MKNTTSLPFYPARENNFVIRFFTLYSEFLLKLRFKNVFLSQNTLQSGPILVYSNHSYWWDALLPLVLNRHVFHRNARAIMEDKQMKQYSFFSRIGAFSVNLEGKHLRKTLDTAIQWLQSDQNILFLYPQGKMFEPEKSHLELKNGLFWIASKSEAACIPVAHYISYHKFSKPELFISVGNALPKISTTADMETALNNELQKCKDAAFDRIPAFKKLL